MMEAIEVRSSTPAFFDWCHEVDFPIPQTKNVIKVGMPTPYPLPQHHRSHVTPGSDEKTWLRISGLWRRTLAMGSANHLAGLTSCGVDASAFIWNPSNQCRRIVPFTIDIGGTFIRSDGCRPSMILKIPTPIPYDWGPSAIRSANRCSCTGRNRGEFTSCPRDPKRALALSFKRYLFICEAFL